MFKTKLIIYLSLVFVLIISISFLETNKIFANDLLVISNAENQEIFNNIKSIKNVSVFNKSYSQYFIVIEHLLDISYINKFFNDEFILIIYSNKNLDNSMVMIMYDNINDKILFTNRLYYYGTEFIKSYISLYITTLINILNIYKKEKYNEIYTYSISTKTIEENGEDYYIFLNEKDKNELNFNKILFMNILLQKLEEKQFYQNIQKAFFKKKFNKITFFDDLIHIAILLTHEYDKVIKHGEKLFYLYSKKKINKKLANILKRKDIDDNMKFIISYLVSQ